MDGISLIQDLAVVLLAAGLAGLLCRRLGLSVIVGYLLAGVAIGPHTPPFSFIHDVDRIQTLSQIGLVFLMFAIGLGLSISKLGRMGWPTLLATGLGAFFMLNLTQLLGLAVGWTSAQSLFVAAMFMVSSSAVIAKIVGELNLSHERSAQLALSITVMEDVVAVVMLTLLATYAGQAQQTSVGWLLTSMSAFVVLLVGAGLLMVPRLMRRLEARADPELQTIIVAGLLFLLAIAAAKAGYSLALGAFLLGAIVAEIPQKGAVEKSFSGMRDLFSSVFFVSIGMMIDPFLLKSVWPLVIGLTVFVLIGRAMATGMALIICGTRPHEARRAGLLLGPLGEFSFIIAQLGVSSAVLPPRYYPLAVGVSILTVLLVPLINRHATAIVAWSERIEPPLVRRAFEAYHNWLGHVQSAPTTSVAWKLVRGRLVQVGVEVLFVTGVISFSRLILGLLLPYADTVALSPEAMSYVFWSTVTVIALVPLFAIWRNLSAIAMIVAESLSGSTPLPATVVESAIKGLAAVLISYWLFLIVPTDQLGAWGWLVLAAAALAVVAVFSSRLVYWHSHWQSSVREVLAEEAGVAAANAMEVARGKRMEDLRSWDLHLAECVVPDAARYGGQTLLELAIPNRFDCAVLELERNGHVITAIRPELRVYPGDKLLLLGQTERLDAACEALTEQKAVPDQSEEFRGSVLETFPIGKGPHIGRSLAELRLSQTTGTRVVGIQRGEGKIIAPSGEEKLEAGDNVLVAGTLAEISAFRRWLRANAPVANASPAAPASN
ncbi:MAG TPA: cation:proton antiporter [Opitutus sp.]|nr:cation:proton antiporter [Opitutus sp.]